MILALSQLRVAREVCKTWRNYADPRLIWTQHVPDSGLVTKWRTTNDSAWVPWVPSITEVHFFHRTLEPCYFSNYVTHLFINVEELSCGGASSNWFEDQGM